LREIDAAVFELETAVPRAARLAVERVAGVRSVARSARACARADPALADPAARLEAALREAHVDARVALARASWKTSSSRLRGSERRGTRRVTRLRDSVARVSAIARKELRPCARPTHGRDGRRRPAD